jgi:hypothetical protein
MQAFAFQIKMIYGRLIDFYKDDRYLEELYYDRVKYQKELFGD